MCRRTGWVAEAIFRHPVEEIVRANLYKQIGLFPVFAGGKKERQQVSGCAGAGGQEEYQNRLIGRLSGGAAAESAPGTRPGQRAEALILMSRRRH